MFCFYKRTSNELFGLFISVKEIFERFSGLTKSFLTIVLVINIFECRYTTLAL